MAASLVHLLLSWGISVAEGVPRRSEKEGARRTVATRGTAGCRRKAALAAPGAAVCVPLAALLVADDCGDLRQLRGCPHPAPAPRGAERRCGRIGVVAINDWWSADPAERFWMETTGRNDLGAELHAPQLNGGWTAGVGVCAGRRDPAGRRRLPLAQVISWPTGPRWLVDHHWPTISRPELQLDAEGHSRPSTWRANRRTRLEDAVHRLHCTAAPH